MSDNLNSDKATSAAAPPVAANPTADRIYLQAIAGVCQHAATRGDDNEVKSAFRALQEMVQRRGKQDDHPYSFPALGEESFNASPADIAAAWS